MLQHTYVENNHLVYSLSKNEQSIHRYQRWTISVLILVSVEYAYVYSTCRQGYPRTDTSRHLYSHTEVSLRYFYLMDYYLLSTGTGISIYTRPMSAWKSAEIRIWGIRNLPTCGCKSMVEGLTIMLGVFINLLCTYTMPNKHYYSKPTSLRCHLMAKHCLKVGRKIRIWGKKSANMWL